MPKTNSVQKKEDLQEMIINLGRRGGEYAKLMMSPPEYGFGVTSHDVVYQKERMRLLHYLGDSSPNKKPPVLMVYAVINKPYVLDLHPRRSVIRRFLKKGFDVYLIDWGSPSRFDRYISTEDYIERYIDFAVDWITDRCDSKEISLFGYCLGGTFATIYAATHPDKVKNLMIMAAPIEFKDDYGLLNWWTNERHFNAEKLVKAFGIIPDYLFTYTFKCLDPAQNLVLKYIRLFEKVEDEKFVDMFFRMEQWIHDGVPVTGSFYTELIEKWYQGNQIVKGEFIVDGHRVDLKQLQMPIMTITGEKDHICPPESTKSLLSFVSSNDTKMIECNCGHIGLSVGSKAHREVWPKVTSWLAKRSSSA